MHDAFIIFWYCFFLFIFLKNDGGDCGVRDAMLNFMSIVNQAKIDKCELNISANKFLFVDFIWLLFFYP